MSVAPSGMPRICTIDERFQSFNVDCIGLHRGADSGRGRDPGGSARHDTLVQDGLLGEAPARFRRTLEDDAGLGHGRGDHVRFAGLLGHTLMEEIASAPQASSAAFIDGAAIARS